nr:hypothetical protein [Muribaculaceae bacterium]
MNYEIRIFANPAGYQEIKLKPPGSYILYTDDVVKKRNFDGERGAFPNGTFSIFYTPNAYVIAYHFSLPGDTGFRESEAQVAVAIKRGYRLLNPYETFEKLANFFRDIILEFKDTYKNQIFNKTETFYNIVSPNVIPDDQQFNINTSSSIINRGILAFDNSEERDSILSDPFRLEFKGIGVLFVMSREEAKKLSKLSGYKLFPNFDFSAAKSYTLVYPDGVKKQFHDINEELPLYQMKRPYEKELIFEGNISDNFSKWKINISDDKTEYRIGLIPEKEIKNIKIDVTDKRGNRITDEIIRPEVGTYSNGIWTLHG